MKGLLVIAHGSRRQQSNEEVIKLADKLKEKCAPQYTTIHAGFLEIARPSISEGIKKCIDDGATSIVVLPYFLNSGRHVIEDIPRLVKESQHQHPNVEIKIGAHLGASDMIMDLLINLAKASN